MQEQWKSRPKFFGAAQPRLNFYAPSLPPRPTSAADRNHVPQLLVAIMATDIVLPGDEVPQSILDASQNHKKPLIIGPGLRHIPPSTITTTIAGSLNVDTRKNAIWVERNGGRVSFPPRPAVLRVVELIPSHSTCRCKTM